MSAAAHAIETARAGYHYARDYYRLLRAALLICMRRPRRVVFFNPYYPDNPYQTLMYQPLANDTLALPLSISGACMLQQYCKGPAYVFHQHWLEPATLRSQRRASRYLQHMQQFKECGGKIIWTLHNAIAHELQDIGLEISIRTSLAQLAHSIHLHYPKAADILNTYYPLPAERIVVAPHGHYDDVVAPHMHAAPAIAHAQTLRFFSGGLIRTYKGLDKLCSLFDGFAQGHATLVIAGRRHGKALTRARNVEQYLQRQTVNNADMCRLMRSCHFTVLAYKRSLTSGMLLYSLTCGVPVIAPNYGHFAALIDGSNGILYDMDDTNGLRNAIETARRLSPDAYEQMRVSARKTALRYPWAGSTKQLFS